ncbi:thioredoxin-like protein [Melampsora americana]|nr:thioredoxin-like protein [Melampsora americana]
MRTFSLLTAFVALAICTVRGDSAIDDSEVIDLKAESFKSTIDTEPLILVEFSTCGHCKALAPHYAEAAIALKPKGIKLAKVDCTAETTLCADQGVQGYPTLKLFNKGVPTDYNGPRQTDGIVSYMIKRSLPVVSYLSPANHTEFSSSDKVVVIAYLDVADTANLDIFKSFAEVKDVKKPSVVVWKKFDEGRNDHHAEKFTAEISPSNFQTYAEAGIPLAYVFIESNNPHREALGKINFVWIDATKFADHAKSLNLHDTNWPAFAIQNIEAQTKFPLDQKKTVDFATVSHFVKDFVAGKLLPSLKSATAPKKQGPGSHVLVTDEFESVVYGDDNKKDVFIEFYAPWCGHCKKLKPTWDNLAHKWMLPENDVPPSTGIRVEGFPTLMFKKAGSKEYIPFEGERTLDGLIEFVEKNTEHKAVKVEIATDEEGEPANQVVLDDESSEESEDKDAEHDEL